MRGPFATGKMSASCSLTLYNADLLAAIESSILSNLFCLILKVQKT